MEFKIGTKMVGPSHSTYFIADIAANHDGDLDRAKALIHLAKEAGADAAKFQNFTAKNNQLGRFVVREHELDKLFSERTCSAGN